MPPVVNLAAPHLFSGHYIWPTISDLRWKGNLTSVAKNHKFTAFLISIVSAEQSFECNLSIPLLSITGLGILSLQRLCGDPAELFILPEGTHIFTPSPDNSMPRAHFPSWGGLHCLQPQEKARGTACHPGLGQQHTISLDFHLCWNLRYAEDSCSRHCPRPCPVACQLLHCQTHQGFTDKESGYIQHLEAREALWVNTVRNLRIIQSNHYKRLPQLLTSES